MKILITTDCYLPMVNGVVTSIQHLTKYLSKMGHEVKILTLSRDLHSYVDGNVTYLGSMDADLVYPDARVCLPICNELVENLLEWHPDIIHSQSEFSSYILARRMVHRLNIPIIHTYHTAYEDYTHYFSPSERIGKAIVASASRWLCKNLQAVIVPTEKVRKMLEGYGIGPDGRRVYIVPTGIEASPFEDHSDRSEIRAQYGVDTDTCLLIAVGRLGKEKNFAELLQYMNLLKEKNIRLMIVGDGPDRQELMKTAERLNLNDRVIFTGMIPHDRVAACYTASDVFVCASSSETQGLTYLEAQAAGLPILCRRDECLKDVVIDGVNGWQYDHFEDFTRYMTELMNPKLRQKMGYAAHEHMVTCYSAEVFAQRALGIYEEVARIYQQSLAEQVACGK